MVGLSPLFTKGFSTIQRWLALGFLNHPTEPPEALDKLHPGPSRRRRPCGGRDHVRRFKRGDFIFIFSNPDW